MANSREATAETRPVLVLSCDIVGWTDLSGAISDLHDRSEILRTFRTLTSEIFSRYGGQDIENKGDEMRAHFGTEKNREVDPIRAVEAGLEIVQSIKNASFPNGLDISVRVGIASAMAYVERIDPDGENSLTLAVGDALNLAARLQSEAPIGGVLICARTFPLVEQYFSHKVLDGLDLKGFRDQPQAFLILTRYQDPHHFLAASHNAQAPLAGRDEMLSSLKASWKRAQSGQLQLVLLTGEPGIGKSRLVHELLRSTAVDGKSLVRLTFFEDRSDRPLDPVIRNLRRQLGVSNQSRAEKFLAPLRDLAKDLDEDAFVILARSILPELADTLQSLPATHLERQEKLFDAFGTLLLNRIGQEPAIIIIEDLHWADLSSMKLFEHLLGRFSDRSLLVLLTSREAPERLTGLFGTSQLVDLASWHTVDPLKDRDSAAIIAHFAQCDATDHLVIDSTQACDGIPYYAEELGKRIRANATELPFGVATRLYSQLDRLPRTHVSVLTHASVIGREFDDNLLRKILRDCPRLDRVLADLVDMKTIVVASRTERETIYHFRQAMMHEAAYGRPSREEKCAMHGSIADTLETDMATEDFLRLAKHLSGARDDIGAVRTLARSVQQALRRQLIDDANIRIELVRKSLTQELDASVISYYRAFATICSGKVHIMTVGSGDPKSLEVWQVAVDEADQANRNDLFFEASAGLYAGQILVGNLDAAGQTAQLVLERGRNTTPDHADEDTSNVPADISQPSQAIIAEVISRRMQATILFLKGQISEANQLFRETLESLDAQEDLLERIGYDEVTEQRTTLLAYYCVGLAISGQISEALKVAEIATEGHDQAGYGHGRCFATSFRAGVHLLQRNYKDAQHFAEQTISFAGERGFPTFFAMCLTQLNNARAHSDDPLTALQNIQQALHRFNDGRASVFVGYVRSLLAEALIKCGLHEPAGQQIDAAIAKQVEIGERWNLAELYRMRGIVHANMGARDEAISSFKAAVTVAEDTGTWLWHARAQWDLAELGIVDIPAAKLSLRHLDKSAKRESENLRYLVSGPTVFAD